MRRFLIHWILLSASLGVAAYLLPGVQIESLWALLVGGLALGFVNAVIKPIMVWMTMPITLLSLGLFLLVINGAAFVLAAWLVPGFGVQGFGVAIVASLVVSVVSWLLSGFKGS